MSEKIKGMFGSKTRADEVLAWLKSQGAVDFKGIYDASSEHSIYYVEQGNVKVINERYSILLDIVELSRWRAKYDEKYYYVSDGGCVKDTMEDLSSEDDERYECDNYFKTREEAEKYAEKFRENFKERRGIILNGEIYEAIEGSCKDCALYKGGVLTKWDDYRCRPLCEGFEGAGYISNCAFKIIKNTKSLNGDISKLVDDNLFDLV